MQIEVVKSNVTSTGLVSYLNTSRPLDFSMITPPSLGHQSNTSTDTQLAMMKMVANSGRHGALWLAIETSLGGKPTDLMDARDALYRQQLVYHIQGSDRYGSFMLSGSLAAVWLITQSYVLRRGGSDTRWFLTDNGVRWLAQQQQEQTA